MGITNLLPHLKSIQTTCHVEQYRGKKVGIDGYVWLHRGAFACAWDLTIGNQSTLQYVNYMVRQVNMLRHYGVEPIVVFDGGPLPSKKATEERRAASRQHALEQGKTLAHQGKNKEALDCFRKAVDVTPLMSYHAQCELKRLKVEFVVAPYEADAQLAYLATQGYIDAIITEDSDLLLYGAPVPILYKLDKFGQGVEIAPERFGFCQELRMDGWKPGRELRWLGVLVGCDYCPGVQGLGVRKAHALIRKWGRPISETSFDRIVRAARMDKNLKLPPDYAELSRLALLTFAHQRVFCPKIRALCHVSPLLPHMAPFDETQDNHIGISIPDDIAIRLADGLIHPVTLQPFEVSQTQPTTGALADKSPLRPLSCKQAKQESLRDQQKLNKGTAHIKSYFTATSPNIPSKVAKPVQIELNPDKATQKPTQKPKLCDPKPTKHSRFFDENHANKENIPPNSPEHEIFDRLRANAQEAEYCLPEMPFDEGQIAATPTVEPTTLSSDGYISDPPASMFPLQNLQAKDAYHNEVAEIETENHDCDSPAHKVTEAWHKRFRYRSCETDTLSQSDTPSLRHSDSSNSALTPRSATSSSFHSLFEDSFGPKSLTKRDLGPHSEVPRKTKQTPAKFSEGPCGPSSSSMYTPSSIPRLTTPMNQTPSIEARMMRFKDQAQVSYGPSSLWDLGAQQLEPQPRSEQDLAESKRRKRSARLEQFSFR